MSRLNKDEEQAVRQAEAYNAERNFEELPHYPSLGTRVCRGTDWKWDMQDGGGYGTVVKHLRGGVVVVQWDYGHLNSYRHGAERAFDLQVMDDLRDPEGARFILPGEHIKVGVRVQRGPDWQWGDEDGGDTNIGAVYYLKHEAYFNVRVRWANGNRGVYRYTNGIYELKIMIPGTATSISPMNLIKYTGKIERDIETTKTPKTAAEIKKLEPLATDFTQIAPPPKITPKTGPLPNTDPESECTQRYEYKADYESENVTPEPQGQPQKKSRFCGIL